MKKEELERINQASVMKNQFESYFATKVKPHMYWFVYGQFVEYVSHIGTEVENELLEGFAKDYFQMAGVIVADRNELIERIASESFKNEKFLNKIRIKKDLKSSQQLCDKLNAFEKEFYERTNISLLRVENERCAKEKNEGREELVEQ